MSVFILILLDPPLWTASESHFPWNKLILDLWSGGRVHKRMRSLCVSLCIHVCRPAVILMQQLAHVFIHLWHHSRSGVNLRGMRVGYGQIHYARPRLCPHVAWKERRQHSNIFFFQVMGQVILCSAGVKPSGICGCESVQSPTVWNCHTQSHAWRLWKQIKSCLNPNASTANDRISMGYASTQKESLG